MTIYHIDLHEVVHTCLASDQPHAWDIRRTIVGVIDGGPCRTPHKTASGLLIACGSIRPRDKQCIACKVQIIIGNTTVDDRGYEGPEPCQGTLFEAVQ